jgi:hypothetical protein
MPVVRHARGQTTKWACRRSRAEEPDTGISYGDQFRAGFSHFFLLHGSVFEGASGSNLG